MQILFSFGYFYELKVCNS